MSLEVGPDGSGSPAQGYSCMFYKLMVPSILQDKKLKIPKKFVKRYGDELTAFVTIIVPDGRMWLIELQKVNAELWFRNGWQEFMEFYSLGTGHFLVFRYEGKSRFNVHIFDLTVSEIKYPFSAPVSLWKPNHDMGVQLNPNELGSIKTEGPAGRRRTRADTYEHEVPGLQKVEAKSSRLKLVSEFFSRRWRPVTPEEKERTVRAAYMLKPENPFFRVILRASYVYRGYLMHIPSAFARVYLKRATGFVTLQDCSGKQWQVRCVYKHRQSSFSQGWPEFVWENKLEEGDVCVFELIDATAFVLKVTILRVIEKAENVS
ncbi:hypothetical protein Tsubulata_011087 [Turnera subulata]|uniref:TF-B3 domain-containing protein n=1 Tax=Turnera subulata TaxID=218843 RepID=A0A9Q0F9K4_9ROSI|nr:hypothetical protein Tsubulata_011087 [Turnera subulata]